jgi:hypothetical protein
VPIEPKPSSYICLDLTACVRHRFDIISEAPFSVGSTRPDALLSVFLNRQNIFSQAKNKSLCGYNKTTSPQLLSLCWFMFALIFDLSCSLTL